MALLKRSTNKKTSAKERLKKRRQKPKRLTIKQRKILGRKISVKFDFPRINLLTGKERGSEHSFSRNYEGMLEEVKDDSPISRVALSMRNPDAPYPNFQRMIVLPWDFWDTVISNFRMLQDRHREKLDRQREWPGSSKG